MGLGQFLLLLSAAMGSAATSHAEPMIALGGRIKADVIYNGDALDGRSRTKSNMFFSPKSIPLDNSAEQQWLLNGRESRFWVTAHVPLLQHDLAAYAELDLFDTETDSSGQSRLSNTPRLRHAYARLKGVTIGRTFSTFSNVASFPELNDAGGPVGVLNIRQELISYEKTFGWGKLILGLEEPQSTLTSADGETLIVNDLHTPDVAGRVEFGGEWGNWSVAALVRDIHHEGLFGDSDIWGGAISIAGRILVGDADNVRFSFSYGNALGRYLSPNLFDDAVFAPNGEIDLTKIGAGYLSYQHWWTRKLRSSLTAGVAHANRDVPGSAALNKAFYSVHVNLIWNPVLATSLGVEWIHGHRELENGLDGHLDRIQFSAIHRF